jgi:hypothetical protein
MVFDEKCSVDSKFDDISDIFTGKENVCISLLVEGTRISQKIGGFSFFYNLVIFLMRLGFPIFVGFLVLCGIVGGCRVFLPINVKECRLDVRPKRNGGE